MNLIAALHAPAAAPTISLVAADGQTATTTVGTGTYLAFSAPNINGSDGVAFNASLIATKGGTITTANNFGNWANHGSATLDLISQIGYPAPVTTGSATFATYVNVPFYNDANNVAFGATLRIAPGQATALTNTGIWSDVSGSLKLVARKGSLAHGITVTSGTATFNTFLASGLTDSHAVVIASLNLGGGVTLANNQAVWEGTQESDLVPVVRTGDPVVDGNVTPTATYTIAAPLSYYSTAVLFQGQNRAFATGAAEGDVALLTNLAKGSVLSNGIVTSIGGHESILAKLGDPAPGIAVTSGTATFARLASPMINANDHVAFVGSATGRGLTTTNSIAIWSNVGGTLTPVYRTGQTATVNVPTFVTLSDPLLNDNDKLAFAAAVKVGNLARTTLFCDSAGTLTQVAQVGQQAPGYATGVKFASFTVMGLSNGGGATGQGGVVFQGTVSGPGVTIRNSTGIWAVDNTGALQLVQHTGDVVNLGTVGSPINKTIVGLYLSSFTRASATTSLGVSKSGDIAFSALFSDYSGATFTAGF